MKNVNRASSEDLTQAGIFMGSPKYMAPEQIQGGEVDARTDIYSFGVVLYEMLTGRVPFDKGNSVHTMISHIKEEVPPLQQANPNVQVGPLMTEVVYRCLAKDPSQRFASMDEILLRLKAASGGALTSTHLSGEQAISDSGPAASTGPQPVGDHVRTSHLPAWLEPGWCGP